MKANKRRGYTVIELILVLALIGLIGSTLVSVLGSGGNAFKHVEANYASQSEARIALSYITVKLRQYDYANAVSMDDETLVIKPPKLTGIGDVGFRIWYDSGELREQYSLTPESGVNTVQEQVISKGLSNVRMELTVDGAGARVVKLEVDYRPEEGAELRTLQSSVTLRSDYS